MGLFKVGGDSLVGGDDTLGGSDTPSGAVIFTATFTLEATGGIWLNVGDTLFSATFTLTATGHGLGLNSGPGGDTLLSMRGASYRRETVVWEVTDSFGNLKTNVTPSPGATLTVDTSRSIIKTISGFQLDVADTAKIDFYSDHIRPFWLLSDGTRKPLGVFLFSDASRRRRSYGVELDSSTLYDQTPILAQPLSRSLLVAQGANLATGLTDLVEAFGIVDHDITPTAQTSASNLSWPLGDGSATGLDVAQHLAGLAGYVVYFNNVGTFIGRPIPIPGVDFPEDWAIYDDGTDGRIIEGSLIEADQPITHPSKWVVVATDSGAAEVTGSFRVSPSSPASAQQRGFEVVKRLDVPGLKSAAAADLYAREYASRDRPPETLEFDAVADPRHDVWDVVKCRGVAYLEAGHSLTLEPGGTHHHSLRKVYANA